MTQKIKHRISDDSPKPGRKYYSFHSDGYGHQNGDFAFSSDIQKWMVSKVSARRKHKALF